MGQQWLIGALPVTPGLAPAESPVPPHQYACAHSEPLETALGNFYGRCPPGTPDGMESDSMLVPFSPCTLWEFLHQHPWSCWWPELDTIWVKLSHGPWHSEESQNWCPLTLAGSQESVSHTCSPTVLHRGALATPACRFMQPVSLQKEHKQ